MATGQDLLRFSQCLWEPQIFAKITHNNHKELCWSGIKEDNTHSAIFWLLFNYHTDTFQSLKATCKLPSPQNLQSFTNPYSHHLKLCVSFLGFVTKPQMDTEKSQFSKKSTSIIPQGQCHANGMCVMKLIKPLVFCLLCSFCSPLVLLISVSSAS